MRVMNPITGCVTVSCEVKFPEGRMLSSEKLSHAIDASSRDTLPGTVWEMGKWVRIQHQSPPQSTYIWHAACEDSPNRWNTMNGSGGHWSHADKAVRNGSKRKHACLQCVKAHTRAME